MCPDCITLHPTILLARGAATFEDFIVECQVGSLQSSCGVTGRNTVFAGFKGVVVNVEENQMSSRQYKISAKNDLHFNYSHFMKMGLDDHFWNDGFLCLSRDPWAVDPVVRTGIHAMLGVDQSNKELLQLNIEVWHALSWALLHLKKLII
ncbi:uncharacterized protein VP01_597g3 [Puccinia sorghi]|uniref:Uncharacterized protein n=1 Tax=Puccinia sorghi TaxID=27349 RepID=A0A0L6UHH8_9BASI|nr:uncharacterized protein VP01_597g3 [Puccinia sorghi]